MIKIQEKISGGLGLKLDDKFEESSINLDYTRIEGTKKPYTEIQIENATNDDINNNFDDINQTIQKKRNNKNSTRIIIAIIAFITALGGTLVVLNYNKKLKELYKERIEYPESEIDSDVYEPPILQPEEDNDTIEIIDDKDWDPDPYESWDPTDSGWGY